MYQVEPFRLIWETCYSASPDSIFLKMVSLMLKVSFVYEKNDAQPVFSRTEFGKRGDTSE